MRLPKVGVRICGSLVMMCCSQVDNPSFSTVGRVPRLRRTPLWVLLRLCGKKIGPMLVRQWHDSAARHSRARSCPTGHKKTGNTLENQGMASARGGYNKGPLDHWLAAGNGLGTRGTWSNCTWDARLSSEAPNSSLDLRQFSLQAAVLTGVKTGTDGVTSDEVVV